MKHLVLYSDCLLVMDFYIDIKKINYVEGNNFHYLCNLYTSYVCETYVIFYYIGNFRVSRTSTEFFLWHGKLDTDIIALYLTFSCLYIRFVLITFTPFFFYFWHHWCLHHSYFDGKYCVFVCCYSIFSLNVLLKRQMIF